LVILGFGLGPVPLRAIRGVDEVADAGLSERELRPFIGIEVPAILAQEDFRLRGVVLGMIEDASQDEVIGPVSNQDVSLAGEEHHGRRMDQLGVRAEDFQRLEEARPVVLVVSQASGKG